MRRFKWIEEHPVEAVVFVFALGLAFFAAFLLSPFYHNGIGNTVAASLPARWQEQGLASFFIVTSIPGLVAPFNKKIPNVWLEWGTMGMFMSFLFLFLLRVTLYGWIPFTWLPLLIISIASGILRIYLRSHR